MTRLETQLQAMRDNLAQHEAFAAAQQAKFNDHLNVIIIPLLHKYKLGVVNPDQNTHIDYISENRLAFRVYLSVDLSKMTPLRLKRLEKSLRDADIPMPICPLCYNSIHLVYTDKTPA